MSFLYDLGVGAYTTLLRLAAPFHPKAAHWVAGRAGWQERLRAALAATDARVPLVWLHAASLGEFEQGRPVLEALRAAHGPGLRLLVTFFSPSGYEIRHSWPGADVVAYLPTDSAANAAAFLDTVRPTLAIFVKYEFWHHYLHGLRAQSVPTFLIAAAFRPEQIFFKPWGGFFRALLPCFTHIFTQNEASARLLTERAGMPPAQVSVAGDPRYDRVLATAAERRRLPLVETFRGAPAAPVLVVGSAWPADLRALRPALDLPAAAGLQLIVAPHEVDAAALQATEAALAGLAVLRYSAAMQADSSADFSTYRVLLIDNIGLLSTLYGYATVAYVGGAFGAGLHNVLEAAVFGAPVLFGPRITRFPEAAALIAAGGGRSVGSPDELALQLTAWLTDEPARQMAGTAAAAFVARQAGATALILRSIESWLPPALRPPAAPGGA